MGFVADRLKSARALNRLSQMEVMRLTQINNKTLSGYENAVSEPDYGTLLALAKLYGVSTDYLLGRVDSPTDSLVPEKKITLTDLAGENIGDIFPVPEQINLPIIGVVRAGPGGIAFEDPQGFASTDRSAVPDGSRHFFFRVKGESMSPEIMPGDLALVREQPEVEYGELAVVIVDGEEGTIERVFPRNGEVFLQATNPSYNRTEKANNVKIVGKVKKTVRIY